jgi:TM2 domain-containing membrane protein YozV
MTQPAIVITSDQQRAAFHSQIHPYAKDEATGVLLALILGSFGAHHFYLGRNGLGILYLLFFWTGLPALLGFIECFFMPARVRRYNAEHAQIFASTLLAGGLPVAAPPLAVCTACGAGNAAVARFCHRCGAAVAV